LAVKSLSRDLAAENLAHR